MLPIALKKRAIDAGNHRRFKNSSQVIYTSESLTIYIGRYMCIVMARKKISTTVYITEDQNQRLKLLNQKTKVPIAEYIREGIDLVLKLHREQLPGQMSFEEDTFGQNSPSAST